MKTKINFILKRSGVGLFHKYVVISAIGVLGLMGLKAAYEDYDYHYPAFDKLSYMQGRIEDSRVFNENCGKTCRSPHLAIQFAGEKGFVYTSYAEKGAVSALYKQVQNGIGKVWYIPWTGSFWRYFNMLDAPKLDGTIAQLVVNNHYLVNYDDEKKKCEENARKALPTAFVVGAFFLFLSGYFLRVVKSQEKELL